MMFEVPPCADGHDEDCPELVCTRCGAAEVVAPHQSCASGSAPRRRRVAPQQRRAA